MLLLLTALMLFLRVLSWKATIVISLMKMLMQPSPRPPAVVQTGMLILNSIQMELQLVAPELNPNFHIML